MRTLSFYLNYTMHLSLTIIYYDYDCATFCNVVDNFVSSSCTNVTRSRLW